MILWSALPAAGMLPVASVAGTEPAGATPPVAGTAANNTATCRASGWDMTREMKAFGHPPQNEGAGFSESKLPLLRPDTLYALRLHAQNDVRFVRPPGRPGKAVTPMGGMARFALSTSGSYRVTVDSPLWIDVVTPQGLIAPAAYTGWHDCSLFRKSVVFTLEAGQTATLQFSDAATDLVKVTIEPSAR